MYIIVESEQGCLVDLLTYYLLYRILALEKLGAVFNQVSTPLKYSPRKFAVLPDSSNVVVIETDHNAYTETTKAQRKQQMAEVSPKYSFIDVYFL